MAKRNGRDAVMADRRVALVVVICLLAALSVCFAAGKPKQATFTELTTKKAAPKPRVQSVVVFRKKANQLVVFGGGLEGLNPQGDLWVLDLKTREWSRIEPKNGDLKKVTIGVGVYDSKRDRIVVTVPLSSGGIQTHWYSFADNTWHHVSHTGEIPKTLPNTPAIYDPKTDSMVFFGRSAWENPDNTRYRTVYYNDVYSLSLADFKWKRLKTKGDLPLPRDRHSEIYDSKTGSLVVFGGIGTGKDGRETIFNDVYRLDLAKLEWKKVETKGTVPKPRFKHCAVYDPVKHRMIVLGGQYWQDKYYSELLALDLSTNTWSAIKTKLPVRLQTCDTEGVWDSLQNRALFFGGIQPGRMLMNSVWELAER